MTRNVHRLAACALALAFLHACGEPEADRRPGDTGAPTPRHPAMTLPGEAPSGRGGDSTAPSGQGPPGQAAIEPVSAREAPAVKASPRAGANVAAGEREVLAGPVIFTAPQGWVRRPPSSGILVAEFGLPRAEGDPEDGRFTVSSAGGSVQANIARWQSQFKEGPAPSTERREVEGFPVTTVRFAGTLVGGPVAGGGGEKPNSRMWGAVIEVPGLEQKVFLKATGPQKTVDRWEESFGKLLDSLRKRE